MKNKTSMLLKLACILLLYASFVNADYVEGIDTTDSYGYGMDSAFSIKNGNFSIGENAISLECYLCKADLYNCVFNYSFDDIKIAPATFLSNNHIDLEHCFVIKRKDSTYLKIQVLNQLTGNQYVFKYGLNTTPNNMLLDSSAYDLSVKYKPNNFCFIFTYPTSLIFKWDRPLSNNNNLLGYIFYVAKKNVTIDTTAPIDLSQWDSVAFWDTVALVDSTGSDNFDNTGRASFVSIMSNRYFNLVALYTEGKSDFIEGWSKWYTTATAIGITADHACNNYLTNKIEVKKTGEEYMISFPQSLKYSRKPSFAVFNPFGVKVSQTFVANGNTALLKTDNMAEGTYIIRAELPDKSIIAQKIVILK
ncbi:MAG TPA: hypothetical protein DCO75_12170 [Fibrobacteres bacterium]|nr:hypothetical protein [Fibrobacterota bacterium]